MSFYDRIFEKYIHPRWKKFRNWLRGPPTFAPSLLDESYPPLSPEPRTSEIFFEAGVSERGRNDAEFDHPTLRRLQEVALIDLCELVGLNALPGQLWRALRAYPEPDLALTEFVRSLGCDSDAVIRGDREARAGFNDIAEILLDFDQTGPELGLRQRRYLSDLLIKGEHAQFREQARAAIILGQIMRGSEVREDVQRFSAYRDLLEDIKRKAANVQHITVAEAEEAFERAKVYRELFQLFVELDGSFTAICEQLIASPPTNWSEREKDEFAGLVRERDQILENLFGPLDDDLLDQILNLQEALAQLADLYSRTQTAGSDESSTAGPGGNPWGGVMRDEAMRFFGFAAASRPSRQDITRRFHELAKEYHPDRCHDASRYAEMEQRFKLLGTYRDALLDHEIDIRV